MFKSLGLSLCALSIVFASSYAVAEDKPAEAAGHGKAEAPAGGKEAEGKKEPKKTEEEWPKVQAEVAALQAKIKQSEDTIKKLSEDKAKAPTETQKVEITKQMMTEHKALRDLAKEYEIKRNYFLYRFPERGSKEARKYQRIEVKPLEDMENQHSIESRVNQVMKTVRKQYGADEASKQKKESSKKDSKKSEEIDLTAPLILSK